MGKKIITSFVLATTLLLSMTALAFAAGETPPPAPAVKSFLGNPFPTAASINISLMLGVLLYMIWGIAVAMIVISMIIAGFKFITAQGEPGKVADARRSLIWAVVGVTIIVLSFSFITIVKMLLGLPLI